MGVSWLDIFVCLLKFEGFSRQNILGKIRWLLTYPFVLIGFLLWVIFFIFGMLIVMFKSK